MSKTTYSMTLRRLATVRETPGAASLRAPLDVARVCEDMRVLAQECFVTLTIDAKNQLIDRHMVTLGLADACLVHPREVFRAAILDNAVSVMLVHNHPSGDPAPSAEDLRITRQMIEAGKIIDIQVQDHIIIGRDQDGTLRHVSLRAQGGVEF